MLRAQRELLGSTARADSMSRPLHVLLVDQDRALLRHGALVLQEFGLSVTACASLDRAPAALATGTIDFVIADDTTLAGDLEVIRQWKADSGLPHLHVFLLRDDRSPVDIEDAFQAGVDDFLRKPISAGEWLARLRAAARFTEFERRYNQQGWTDAATGLASRQAMVDQLEAEWKSLSRGHKFALVAFEVDFFERWQRLHGELASQPLLREIAKTIEEQGVAGQFAVRSQGSQFLVLLPEHSQDKAVKVAERIRSALGRLQLPANSERLTTSVGVAVAPIEKDSPDAFLARALQALEDARHSGGDCVATYGEFEDERRKWSQQVSSGNPFASCIARDVMTPFTIELNATDTLDYAAALLAQMQLDALPVVDFHSRFVGIVESQRLREALETATRSAQPVEPLMTRDIPKLLESTTFAEVIEHFVQDDQSLLVVTSKDGGPRGYIERDRFLSLVKPLRADHYRSDDYSSGTEYLVVPDLVESL
jgi:diguanylate cyclase (GGDEF)-like protein